VVPCDYTEILAAETVQRVLEQQNRTTPLGRRNYAIMLLLARLGLRAGEVVRLNLEDIDWRTVSSESDGKEAAGRRFRY